MDLFGIPDQTEQSQAPSAQKEVALKSGWHPTDLRHSFALAATQLRKHMGLRGSVFAHTHTSATDPCSETQPGGRVK